MSTPRNTRSESNDIIQVVNAILHESGSLPDQTQHPSRSAPNAPSIAQERQELLQSPNIAEVAHTFPADYAHYLWMTYLVHEQHSVQLGLPTFTSYSTAALANTGMPDSEMREFNSYRHAFPHVPQQLFPMSRSDGLPGQYLHLIQVLCGIDVDPITGLSRSYQILIRFDTGYNDMHKEDVQEAGRARFEAMDILLANHFRESVSAFINRQTKTWLGFIKVDL
jgi:hypothetical protein